MRLGRRSTKRCPGGIESQARRDSRACFDPSGPDGPLSIVKLAWPITRSAAGSAAPAVSEAAGYRSTRPLPESVTNKLPELSMASEPRRSDAAGQPPDRAQRWAAIAPPWFGSARSELVGLSEHDVRAGIAAGLIPGARIAQHAVVPRVRDVQVACSHPPAGRWGSYSPPFVAGE